MVERYLSSLFCAFWKPLLTRHALFTLKQSWEFKLDKPDFAESVVIVLSRVDGYLPHDLLIAGFEAYGISRKKLIFLHSCLTIWMQLITADCLYSFW